MATIKSIHIGFAPTTSDLLKITNISGLLNQSESDLVIRNIFIGDRQPIDAGECWKDYFTAISKGVSGQVTALDLPSNSLSVCCFKLPVFARITAGNEFENDRSAVFEYFTEYVDSVSMFLQKDGVDKIELTDNSYGDFYQYGFHESGNNKYVGYNLNWQDVINDGNLGVGCFRVRFEATDINGGVTSYYSFSFDLRVYSPLAVEGTVRLDYINNSSFGNWKRPEEKINFVDVNWSNSIRIPAEFGRPTTEYEVSTYQQSNNVELDFENRQVRTYYLDLSGIPLYLHHYIQAEVLISDELNITDYNGSNTAGNIINLGLRHNGVYDMDWTGNPTDITATIEFVLRQNNLDKGYC